MTNRLLHITDIHGHLHSLEAALARAEKEGIKHITIGGDLMPKDIALQMSLKRSTIDEEEDPQFQEFLDRMDRETKGMPDNEAEKVYEMRSQEWKEINSYFLFPSLMKQQGILNPQAYGEYVRQMESINRLAKKKQANPIEYLRRDGYCIIPQETISDLSGFAQETEVLDKLMEFFKRSVSTTDDLSFISFTEEELEYVQEFQTLLREVEDGYDEKKKQNILEIAWPFFKDSRLTFEEIRLSRHLYTMVRYDPLYILRLNRKIEETEAELKKLGGEFGSLFANAVKNELQKIQTAITIKNMNNGDYLKSIVPRTGLATILDKYSNFSVDNIEPGQLLFAQTRLPETLRAFKKRNPDVNLYVIIGNDDTDKVEPYLQSLHEEGTITYLNNSAADMGNGKIIFGYPYVKKNDRYVDWWHKSEEEIREDLARVAGTTDPQKTIYLFHTPPYGCNLDLAYNEEHIGSAAVREFLHQIGKTGKSSMSLHGHVHEAASKTGTIVEKFGSVYSFNPGVMHSESQFSAVIVNMDNPAEYEWIRPT